VSIKPAISIRRPTPTIEGAGVRLERAFGFDDSGVFDPFLLFDDFRSENPEDYRAGFPWHPHRGIETITYVLAGTVDHGDSLGNQGTLRAGDVQCARVPAVGESTGGRQNEVAAVSRHFSCGCAGSHR